MKRLLVILLCLSALRLSASHIVGGEFEMVFKRINLRGSHMFNLSMLLYYDNKTPNPGAGTQDGTAIVRIFRIRDNAVVMDNIILTLMLPNTHVDYFQPECSNGFAISTDRLYYTYIEGGVQAELELSPALFDDPAGYYVSWQRCCRNYGINNIYSENPNVGGIRYAGQTFYLEFPALVKNGLPFINSSPRLFPPLSDYACPGKLYYVDFSGTDPDGDSLVYTMATPLNTLTEEPVPDGNRPLPKEGDSYPEVRWRSEAPYFFGPENIMGGNPDLKISIDGLLTVVPTNAGLYVFAVKCEEFRDGEKIGEVRRDFQMLVLAGCPFAQKPQVVAKPVGAPDTEYKPNLSVSFSNNVADNSRCVIVRATDPDSQSPDDNNREDISVRAVPIGFKDNVREVLPTITKAVLTNGSNAEFNICFPRCPYVLGPYKIGIIISDNACPLPLMDTVVVTVDVELPPNNLPLFTPGNTIVETIDEGEGNGSVVWTFEGNDADLEALTITQKPNNQFKLEDYGFQYALTQNQNGHVEATLTWDTRCDVVDFSERTNFPFTFYLDDDDECDLLPPDELDFDLTMNLYDFHEPVIKYAPEPDVEEITITHKVYETVNFDVLGTDEDKDRLVLSGRGIGFNMQDFGISFPGDQDIENVVSPFSWYINCDKLSLDVKNQYSFEFKVLDNQNRCNYELEDLLRVNVIVEPPDNIPPLITANGVLNSTNLELTLGEPLVINVLGTDGDNAPKDKLKIELVDAKGDVLPEGYKFETTDGFGTAQGKFTWNPGCEIYLNADYQNNYKFSFRVNDGRCFAEENNLVDVAVTITDVDGGSEEFTPPNVITPNGDGCNDFFALEGFDDVVVAGTPCVNFVAPNLPNDNCAGNFLSIRVYNRWGRQVFESTDRKFKWHAADQSSGVYFYYINFTNKEFKGALSVAY